MSPDYFTRSSPLALGKGRPQQCAARTAVVYASRKSRDMPSTPQQKRRARAQGGRVCGVQNEQRAHAVVVQITLVF